MRASGETKVPSPHERERILATLDTEILAQWLADVATCTRVSALLDGGS